MIDRQIELARHALGLDGRRKQSYRNYFFASEGHPDYQDWCAMCESDHAMEHPPRTSRDSCFTLTKKGALAALKSGETLDREDFPQ